MLKDIGFEWLEALINRYLDLDTQSQQRFSALNGKLIKIQITLPIKISLYFQCAQNKIFLLSHCQAEPDVVIAGSLLSLIRVWQMKITHTANVLEISGDALVAEAFNSLLQNMNIDWEAHASKYIGATISHGAFETINKIKKQVTKNKLSCEENIKEYLQEELKQLPTKIEVNQFLKQIDELVDDAARAEVKMNRYCSDHIS